MPDYVMIILIVFGIAVGLGLLNLLVYFLFFVRPHSKVPAEKALLCDYAHRGLHGGGVPENSLRAFALACEGGHGIELDVQLSRDGEVMVFHDYTLERMTGDKRRLCELSAEELSEQHLAGTEEVIPSFSQVLRLVDGRVPLLIELKGEDLNTALCAKVAAFLKDYKGAYCVESFNPLLLRVIQKELPGVYCGLLYTNVVRDKKNGSPLHRVLSLMALNFACKPNFIAYNELDRHSLPVRLATGLYRAPKFVWTIRSREALERAHAEGECAIFEKI